MQRLALSSVALRLPPALDTYLYVLYKLLEVVAMFKQRIDELIKNINEGAIDWDIGAEGSEYNFDGIE